GKFCTSSCSGANQNIKRFTERRDGAKIHLPIVSSRYSNIICSAGKYSIVCFQSRTRGEAGITNYNISGTGRAQGKTLFVGCKDIASGIKRESILTGDCRDTSSWNSSGYITKSEL